ncbi:MAG: hypothetical protein VW277_02190 [Candidatus Neomarinimicrobiota bacterium]
MNLNKKLIIVLFAVIFASCSTNNNIQVIDSENIKIEELEKNFNRGNNSIIVFKDFLGRRQYMIEVNNDSIRYLNVRKKVEISQEEFNRFFPLSNQLNSNFYKSILWGDTEALSKVDIQLRNSYVITTKLISIDGSNYLNEIVFLLNNDKQNYTLKFNRRNFE